LPQIKLKFAFLAVGVLCACSSGERPLWAGSPATEQGIQIYFTPSQDCENNIIKRINNANKIEIAVYSITNKLIVDAIKAAYERGAEVRILTDRVQAKGNGSLVSELQAAGLPLRTNVKHAIEHNKFAIFDGKDVVSGSYNWTTSASERNSENCLFFQQPNKEYSNRFEYLWEFYGGKK